MAQLQGCASTNRGNMKKDEYLISEFILDKIEKNLEEAIQEIRQARDAGKSAGKSAGEKEEV